MTFGRLNSIFIWSLCLLLIGSSGSIAQVQAIETTFDALRTQPRASMGGASASRVAAASSAVPRNSAVTEDVDGMVVDGRGGGRIGNDYETLGRELLRRIVKARPSLLEDEERMSRWMAEFKDPASWPGSPIGKLYDAYTRGTEFDRDRALQQFREFLLSQATDEPVKVLRIRAVSLGKYDHQAGAFPLSIKDDDFSDEMIFHWGGSPNVLGSFDELPDLKWLRMPPAEAESLARKFGPGPRLVSIAMRLTLHDFGREPEGLGTPADAKVDSVSVHYCCRPQERLGSLIANLPIKPKEIVPAAPAPSLPAQSALSEKVVDKGSTSRAPGRSASLTAIGLPVVNGIVDFRFAGASLSDQKKTEQAVARLTLLLALRANPSLIDHPDKTINFLKILPDDLGNRYLSNLAIDARQRGTDYLAEKDWRGRDEFERQDTRNRFLREQRDRILALVPEPPIEVSFDQRFSPRDYNPSTQSFPIDVGWENGGFGKWHRDYSPFQEVVVGSPLRYPQRWSMAEKDARNFRELQQKHAELTKAEERYLRAMPGPRPAALFLRARYVITGSLIAGQRLILETALIGLEVVGRKDLSHPIAKLPVPDGTYLAKSSEAGSTYWTGDSKDPVAALDPFLASLIVARTKPERLDDAAALSSAFHIRQRFEHRVFDSKATTDLPRFMTPGLLAEEAKPNPAELSRFKGWLVQQSRSLDKDLRYTPPCHSVSPTRKSVSLVTCKAHFARPKDGKVVVDLLNMLEFGDNQPGYGSSPVKVSPDNWQKPALEAARAKYPAAAGFKTMPSGQVIPVIVALHPSTNWYGIAIEGSSNEFESLSVDFAIRDSVFLPYAPGKEFLLIEIEPTVLRYKLPGANLVTVKLESEPSATPGKPDARAVGHYDLLGVKLGMGLAEAEAALESSLEGKNYTRREERRSDSIFGHAIAYGDFRQDNWGGSFRREKITLFFDPTRESKPVIAVGRKTVFEKQQFKDDASVHQAITPTLFEKYGKPDVYKFASYDYIYWAESPIMKARLKRLDRGLRYDAPCSHFEFRGFYARPNDGSAFQSIPGGSGCGEMLSAEIFTSELKMFLVDTDVFPSMRGRNAEGGSREAEPPASAKPDSVVLLETPDRISSDVGARPPAPAAVSEPPPAPAVAALPPQQPEPATTPAPIDKSFDVVGLRLGMDLAAAENVVRAHMDVAHRLSFSTSSQPLLVPFGNATVFVRKDNSEYIALVTEPSRSGTRVVAIGRYLVMGLGAFDRDEFTTDLGRKFGPSPLRSEEVLYWGGSTDRRTHNPCLVQMGGLGGAGTWTDESGATPDLTRFSPPGANPGTRGPASMPWIGLRVLDLKQASAYRGCGPHVAAWVPNLNGRTGEFAVWLTDTKAYIDILSGPPLSPDATRAKIKF